LLSLRKTGSAQKRSKCPDEFDCEYLQKEINELHQQNIKLRPIGFIKELPKDAQEELIRAQKYQS
jgi:undecaprenyl pyrophosphate synthase